MFPHFFCFTVVLCGVFSFPQSPSCRRDDKSCLKTLAQVVYSKTLQSAAEFEVDPMFQKQIDAALNTLAFTLRDTTIRGFKICEIKDASITSDKKSMHLQMICPRFDLNGHYEADGKIETVPFQGNGSFTLGATDYDIYLEVEIKTTVRDGKKYIKIIDFKAEAELKGDLEFKLENLYNGNKELSEAVHKFIKENPKYVTDFLQKPVFDANFSKLINAFNKILKDMPVDGYIA